MCRFPTLIWRNGATISRSQSKEFSPATRSNLCIIPPASSTWTISGVQAPTGSAAGGTRDGVLRLFRYTAPAGVGERNVSIGEGNLSSQRQPDSGGRQRPVWLLLPVVPQRAKSRNQLCKPSQKVFDRRACE